MKNLALEFNDLNGKCRVCQSPTILVTVTSWTTHNETESVDFVEPLGEVSGHYCPECNCLTAIYLNGIAP